MPLTTAQDFDQELLILFDAYVHGSIDRRGFLEGASKFATGGMTACMLLAALSPNFARAQQVAPDDPRLQTTSVVFSSPAGHDTGQGYLARPAHAAGPLPGVLVIHENRGLNPHIEDIVRRLALANFMAFAPDALAPLGGYPGDEDKARALFADLDQSKTIKDFVAAARYLKSRPDCSGKTGTIGFCYGGGVVLQLSMRLPELDAAVCFYGNAPAAPHPANIRAPLLVHLAGLDERINAAWPAYEAELRAAAVRYTLHRYPGTQHGFNNDTTPRFDAASAQLAWERTLDFLNRNLKG